MLAVPAFLRAYALGLDHHLDRFPVVHRPVALRHFLKADDAVEDAARLDPFLKDIRQKLLDVGADRGRAAAYGDIGVECRLRCGHQLVLGNANATDCALERVG